MPSKTYTNEEIAGYLLEAMPEAEAGSFEQAYFEHPALAAAVSEIENNLIDDYVRGQLPPRERELFEQHYLSHPNRRRRVENARVLLFNLDQLKKSPPAAAERPSWRQLLLERMRGWNLSFAPVAIALLLVAACGGLYLWSQYSQPRRQTAQSDKEQLPAAERAQQPGAAPQATEQPTKETASDSPTADSPPSNGIARTPTLFLTIGAVRDGKNREISSRHKVITPENKNIRLILKREITDYQSYRVEIMANTESGKKIFFASGIKPGQQAGIETSAILVPTRLLDKGIHDYIVQFTGSLPSGLEEPAGLASFRIEKK